MIKGTDLCKNQNAGKMAAYRINIQIGRYMSCIIMDNLRISRIIWNSFKGIRLNSRFGTVIMLRCSSCMCRKHFNRSSMVIYSQCMFDWLHHCIIQHFYSQKHRLVMKCLTDKMKSYRSDIWFYWPRRPHMEVYTVNRFYWARYTQMDN